MWGNNKSKQKLPKCSPDLMELLRNAMLASLIFTVYTVYSFPLFLLAAQILRETGPHRMWQTDQQSGQHVWGLSVTTRIILKLTARQTHIDSAADANKSNSPSVMPTHSVLMGMTNTTYGRNCKLHLLSGNVHVIGNDTHTFQAHQTFEFNLETVGFRSCM